MKILHPCLFFCSTERDDKNLLRLKNNSKEIWKSSWDSSLDRETQARSWRCYENPTKQQPPVATSPSHDLPAGQNTETSKEDDEDGVGSTQQPVVVERPRYPLTQFFSQGHPQLSSPSCHPGIHQGVGQFQHVQRFSQGTVSSWKLERKQAH